MTLTMKQDVAIDPLNVARADTVMAHAQRVVHPIQQVRFGHFAASLKPPLKFRFDHDNANHFLDSHGDDFSDNAEIPSLQSDVPATELLGECKSFSKRQNSNNREKE